MTRKKVLLILPLFLLFLSTERLSAKINYSLHRHAKHVVTSTQTEDECLATAIYWEAGNETESGKIAVAEVILNRYYVHMASSICNVINQKGQFGFKKFHHPTIKVDLYKKCHDIALLIMSTPQNEFIIPKNILYFNTKNVHKFMQHKLHLYETIGNQSFYYKK